MTSPLQTVGRPLKILAILATFFVVAEALLRVQHYGLAGLSYAEMQAQDASGLGVEPPIQDPALRARWDRTRPGWRLTWGFLPRATGFMRGAAIQVNSLGFRGPERTLAKAPNTFRIAVLGNSITFGSGVAIEEAWPSVLERMLNARTGKGDGAAVGRDATRYEVFNLAMTQTWGCFDRHTERALYFQPDLILWSVSRTVRRARSETNLRAAARLAKSHSVPFYAFSIGNNTYNTRNARNPFFELLPPLAIDWGPEHYIYPGDRHPDAFIHRRIAEELAQRLRARDRALRSLAARSPPDHTTSWTPPPPVPSRGDNVMLQNVRQTGFWTSRLWHRLKERWRTMWVRLDRKLG